MKSLYKVMVAILVLLSVTMNAQIKNPKTETVKVYGNCGMCQKTIEKAGSLKNVAKVNWDIDTNIATLTYDTKITNQDEILKRIALSGYDSDKFLAPDDVYNNLHGCCQYDREAKNTTSAEIKSEGVETKHMSHEKHLKMENSETKDTNPLKVVFDSYFAVKDALVKTDGATASAKATELLTAINAVKMNKLEMDVHMVWMKVLSDLKTDAENISKSDDVAKQRKQFMSLSNNIYALLKVSKTETPTYYQFCPMANGGKGANWLSKENAIKNPYYGSQMMSCGKTVETIE